jgi:hypothetical protein
VCDLRLVSSSLGRVQVRPAASPIIGVAGGQN